jgi:membrane protease YdiL (CAAX protease family)
VDQLPENRQSVYYHSEFESPRNPGFIKFAQESGNGNFSYSWMTIFSLVILLIGYPGMSVLGSGMDPTAILRSLDQTMLLFVLIVTIIFQWFIFGFNYLAVYLENTGVKGIGLKRIRLLDFAWAFAFLLAANLILSGLAWVLGQLGYPMSGDIGLLIPKDPTGQVVWVFVAFTAGFCEEVAFRGYLMTRLRLLMKLNSWWIPTILSAVAFGICHTYQGVPGIIIITVYGILFALLYIRTGSLWPCVIAHFLQDFGALFFPQ